MREVRWAFAASLSQSKCRAAPGSCYAGTEVPGGCLPAGQFILDCAPKPPDPLAIVSVPNSHRQWEEWDVRRSLFDNHVSTSMEVSSGARQRIRGDSWQERGVLLVCRRQPMGFRQPAFTRTLPTYSACTDCAGQSGVHVQELWLLLPRLSVPGRPRGPAQVPGELGARCGCVVGASLQALQSPALAPIATHACWPN